MSSPHLLWISVLAVAVAACGDAHAPLQDAGVPDGGDAGLPDGGDAGVADGGDAGTCDVDAIAEALAGDAGTDCGSFVARFVYMVVLDTGWSDGIDCALSAQDAGLPFRLNLTFAGTDSDSISVFVRSADGQSFELSDGSHLPIGSTSTVGQQGCASFSLTTYLGIPIPDGGVPDLSCDSAGSGAAVCTYTFNP